MSIFDIPRYKENPSDIFFDHFVMDVIGMLPPEMSDKLDTALSTSGGNWRQKTKELINLSGTIEIAILDLWYRNSAALEARGELYDPYHFAVNFVDAYFADDSQVDVWPGNALEAAKSRIREAQQPQANT
jgi:hypothetical protein